jgi:N-acetylglucosaminyldiphosphoundecaprenol N-acetyl-beta-D-mannosaminyltransferase
MTKACQTELGPGQRSEGPQKFLLGSVACSSHSIAELLQELRQLLADKSLQPRTILGVNAHIYNLACGDRHLRDCLNAARVVTADGISVVWAARWLGKQLAERCNLTDSYHAFLADEQMPRTQAVLIGCSQHEAEAAAARAQQSSRHCRVVQACSGYLSDGEYEKLLAGYGEIDLILLGMGTPRTEHIAALAARVCPTAVVWGIGGGTVRIEAGTMSEAPPAWRRAGLQWLYRLLDSPRLLWRRYVIGNPLFLLRITREKFKSR